MKLTKKEFDRIIKRHQHWVKHNCTGWRDMRADLSKTDLRDVCLYGVNLSGANLAYADLSWVNLAGANLSGTNLAGAKLYGAELTRANLSEADLTAADLTKANMAGANLSRADLTNADLTAANLSWAKLERARLAGANLCKARFPKANLDDADMTVANLDMADLEHAEIYTASLDQKEEFRKGIVLKRAIKGYKNTYEGVVITAEIPAGAVVFSINGKKCRTSTATIVNMAGHKLLHSQYDHTFTYKLGQKIIIPNFDTRYNVECSTGFHFFRKKADAIGY